MITLHNIEQRSDEWFAIRTENPFTASNAQAIATAGKGLETLAWEALTSRYRLGNPETYTNAHLERGIALESEARAFYEAFTYTTVEEIGFVTNSKYKMAGASPDGLVEDGLVEIKCFDDVKFFKLYAQSKHGNFDVESQYQWQMQMQMLITERDWCDYVIYNENFEQPIIIQRIGKDLDAQEKLTAGLKEGVKLLTKLEKQINEKI